MTKLIDTQFINVIEQENEGVKFVRIDADVASALKAEGKAEENEKLAELFRESQREQGPEGFVRAVKER